MEINWTEIIIVLVNALIVPFVILLIKKLDKLMDAKIGMIEDAGVRDYVSELKDDAMVAVSTAVKETTQTYVDNIKGTEGWNAETQKIAFEKSYARFFDLMKTYSKEELDDILGDVNAWVTAEIEKVVGYTR